MESLKNSFEKSSTSTQAIVIIVALFVAYVLYQDFIYSLVVYPLRARKFKTGWIARIPSRPLGIRGTLRFLRHVRNETLLKFITDFDLSKARKTAHRQGLNKWLFFTREPENIKAILSTKFQDFSLGDRNTHMRPVFGSGIFTQDGSQWKHSRDMLKPQFGREQISRIEEIASHVDIMISEIRKRDGEVELQRFFHLLTMDTATHFLFGESVNSLDFCDSNSKGSLIVNEQTGQKVYSAEFVESYTWLNKFALERLILSEMDWIALLLRPSYRSHQRRAQNFIDHYVHLALETTKNYQASESKEKEESYVFSQELAKITRDPIAIRDQCFNILIAGRDTTASTLAYTFHYFARYPEVYQRVREEVFEVFPGGNTLEITYEDLRKVKYIQMVIKEVLRLAPAVPINMRTAVRDTTLPRGGGENEDQPVFIPKGSNVSYSTHVLQRDPQIYGEDSQEFRPERWAPENRTQGSLMYGWGYIPFNGGPRICLGQQFALTELALTIVKLAAAFESVRPGTGFEDAEPHDRNTLTAMVGGNGVPVILS